MIPHLKPLFNSNDMWDRIKVLNIFLGIGTEAATNAMLGAINDRDLLVQSTLTKNLGRLQEQGKVDVVALLQPYLADSNYTTRTTVLSILDNLAVTSTQLARMYGALLTTQPAQTTELIILQDLAKLGADAALAGEQLIASLETETRADVRYVILNTLATIGGESGEQVYPLLTQMLFSSDWDERQDGIWLLRRLGLSGDEFVILATQSWADSSEQEKLSALELLGHLAVTQKEAAFALINILGDETESKLVRDTTYATLAAIVPQLEYEVDRGVVAVLVPEGVYISWRLLGIESFHTPFNLYRDGEKVNQEPITASTNFVDENGTLDSIYTVRALVDGVEQSDSPAASVWSEQYLPIALQQIPGDDNWEYYVAEIGVGDLTGDGQYDLVVRREPVDGGFVAGEQYIVFEGYQLDGTFLWRINMGPNINNVNALQFAVYDLDSDGRAEVVLRTSNGTVDGMGNVIGDPGVDYRPKDPYHIVHPDHREFISVFDGLTGEMLASAEDIPVGNPARWGDDRGHRAGSRRMAVGYFNGQTPSIVTVRGAYELIEIRTYDFVAGDLVQRWDFSSKDWPGYSQMGNHQLSIADVNGTGKDVITYGAMAVNSDGTGLYTTLIGHGDARTALYNSRGEIISDTAPTSINFAGWWDGDLLRELVDGNGIFKWDYANQKTENIFMAQGATSINGSKSVPALQADLLGDWREEVIWPSMNHREVRVYTTIHPTKHRLYTWMHNRQYRLAVTWQNSGYGQPPHPDFYVGPDMEEPNFNWGLVHAALEQYELIPTL